MLECRLNDFNARYILRFYFRFDITFQIWYLTLVNEHIICSKKSLSYDHYHMLIIICSLSLIEKNPRIYLLCNVKSTFDILFTSLHLIWNRKYCNITYMYKSSYDYCHFFHYKYITISLKWITYMETYSSRSNTPIFNCLECKCCKVYVHRH